MCGICGFVSRKKEELGTLIQMNDMMKHRGPDDHGEELYVTQDGWTVGFAHRRLSIMDLTVNGHQPMHSPDRRITVVFNGEIYNFREIREEIHNYPYKTECDTEVIIAAYWRWGIKFVDRFNGMFAIALYDREEQAIYFLRDRIGKKPFYYFLGRGGEIVFASELKAIMQYPEFQGDINYDVIGRYLHKQYISAPDTIFKNTYKLEAGGILRFSGGSIQRWKYWDVADRYQTARNKIVTDYDQAKWELKNLLKQSVTRRLDADVPIGAFLSGGYDSTLVCALAGEVHHKPLKTFCIGFQSETDDEARYAKKVAQYLGTDHCELYLDEKDMLRLVDDIPVYYDEPFADTSEIATMLVAELAKTQVSVVLSGDGGDELFGGYNIYTHLQKAQSFALKGSLLQCIRKLPYIEQLDIWNQMPLYKRIASDHVTAENRTQTGISQYLRLIDGLLVHGKSRFYYEFESKYDEKRYDITRMLLDQETYLPEDILTKVDRASMKYALECRCPILDKEVIEYSYRLLPDYKDDHGNQKKILKDIAYGMVPRELLDRPKAGFGIPMEKWLRGPLREQLTDWTSRDFLTAQGIFDPEPTIRFVSEYLKSGDQGKGSGNNYSQVCWPYFVFQQWYSEYMY